METKNIDVKEQVVKRLIELSTQITHVQRLMLIIEFDILKLEKKQIPLHTAIQQFNQALHKIDFKTYVGSLYYTEQEDPVKVILSLVDICEENVDLTECLLKFELIRVNSV